MTPTSIPASATRCGLRVKYIFSSSTSKSSNPSGTARIARKVLSGNFCGHPWISAYFQTIGYYWKQSTRSSCASMLRATKGDNATTLFTLSRVCPKLFSFIRVAQCAGICRIASDEGSVAEFSAAKEWAISPLISPLMSWILRKINDKG